MRKMVTKFREALIGAGLGLCVAACAGSPSTPGISHPSGAAAAKLPPAGCVSQSATRISLGPTECGAAGHIWTDETIKSSGATEPGEALRLLDATVTVRSQ